MIYVVCCFYDVLRGINPSRPIMPVSTCRVLILHGRHIFIINFYIILHRVNIVSFTFLSVILYNNFCIYLD